jgi:hypothetical protein
MQSRGPTVFNEVKKEKTYERQNNFLELGTSGTKQKETI